MLSNPIFLLLNVFTRYSQNMPRGRTFFLILRLYLIRERIGLAQLLSLQMCFGQNMKENNYPVKGLYLFSRLFIQ